MPEYDPRCRATEERARDAGQALAREVAPHLGNQPRPLPRLYLAGYMPGQAEHDESVAAVRDLELMRDAALAWRTGAGQAYYELAARTLLAWAGTYQPTLQPIDETHFDTLIDTYAVLKAHLGSEDRRRIGAWLTAWATKYVQAMQAAAARGNHSGGWSNNWQSHRIKLVTMIAAVVDDATLFADARSVFRQHVLENIQADGQVLDFRQRDALHYVVYDIEPLLQAALAARSRGENWYDDGLADGHSLRRAVSWLLPYVTGERTHAEFVRSAEPFDHQRAAAGLKEFSGLFEPRHAARLYWMAAIFEPRYRLVAERLHGAEPEFVAMCGS